MKASFRNCRDSYGGFFQLVESRKKTANRVGKKMICLQMAFPWPLDGTI